MRIFKKKKQEISIYNKLKNFIDQEQKIYIIFEKVENKDKNIEGLEKAFFDFFSKDKKALTEFDTYFRDHEFEEIKDKFQNFLFSIENIEYQRFPGLSILLMRNSFCKETVKLGIYLCRFYPLENYRAAIKILADLALLEEFRKPSLEALKNLGIFELVRDSIYRKIENIEIEEKYEIRKA